MRYDSMMKLSKMKLLILNCIFDSALKKRQGNSTLETDENGYPYFLFHHLYYIFTYSISLM